MRDPTHTHHIPHTLFKPQYDSLPSDSIHTHIPNELNQSRCTFPRTVARWSHLIFSLKNERMLVVYENKIALFFITAAAHSKNRMLMNKHRRELNCVSCVWVTEMGAGQTGSRWQMAERWHQSLMGWMRRSPSVCVASDPWIHTWTRSHSVTDNQHVVHRYWVQRWTKPLAIKVVKLQSALAWAMWELDIFKIS